MIKRILFAVAILAFVVPGVRAQKLFEGPTRYIPVEVDQMYVNGLKFLVTVQQEDGTFKATGSSDRYGSEPGVVGLAVVAMLAHGDDPNRGPYALEIRRGLNMILKNQNSRTGYIGSSMYNHGFAALALAEGYGEVRDPRLGPALRKATDLILNAQKRIFQNRDLRCLPKIVEQKFCFLSCGSDGPR